MRDAGGGEVLGPRLERRAVGHRKGEMIERGLVAAAARSRREHDRDAARLVPQGDVTERFVGGEPIHPQHGGVPLLTGAHVADQQLHV